jgi:hypothetical protein
MVAGQESTQGPTYIYDIPLRKLADLDHSSKILSNRQICVRFFDYLLVLYKLDFSAYPT